jgi:broad specificity phosphatase PhoE
LSVLYLVRHGQGGTREEYDSLSDLGREQSRLLGEYFRSQGVHFDAVYAGGLARQRSTAESALPGSWVIVDSGWNEFDLARVYEEYAPHLCRDDEDFRREYAAMQEALIASQGAHHAQVHRKWNDCDKKLVRAWVENRYPYSGESWPAFVKRVRAALARIVEAKLEGNVIVFTSATPIGICAAQTLDLEDGRAMQLAGVLFNASYSTVRVRGDEIRLFSFNNTGHLADAPLRTFR